MRGEYHGGHQGGYQSGFQGSTYYLAGELARRYNARWVSVPGGPGRVPERVPGINLLPGGITGETLQCEVSTRAGGPKRVPGINPLSGGRTGETLQREVSTRTGTRAGGGGQSGYQDGHQGQCRACQNLSQKEKISILRIRFVRLPHFISWVLLLHCSIPFPLLSFLFLKLFRQKLIFL